MRNRNVRVPAAINPASNIKNELQSLWLHIPLHEAGSAAGKVPIYSNIPSAPAELDMTGTPNYATAVGYNTCNGSTYITSSNAALLNFFAMNGADQLLWACRINQPGAPAAQYWLWSAGIEYTSSAYGAMGFAYNASRQLLGAWKRPGETTNTLTPNTATYTDNTETQVVGFIDQRNLSISYWLNAVAKNSQTLPATASFALNPSRAFTVMARNHNGTPDQIASNTHKFSDYFFLKPTTDISAEVGDIVAAWTHTKLEFPAILRRLGL